MVRDRLLVHFTTTGPEADERLVREYVLDAVDSLPERSSCDGVGFVPAGQKPGVDGLVLLEIVGDVDAVVESQRDRWDALVDDGLAENWFPEEHGEAFVTHWGEDGAALRGRIDILASRTSKLVFEEFDAPPDPVDAHPEEADERESPTGVGWWSLLHVLTLQQGYGYDEEVDAYAEGIRDALYNIAEYEGYGPAIAKLDEVVDSLEAVRDELDRPGDPDA